MVMVFSWVVMIKVNVGRPGGCVCKNECMCEGGCSVIQCSTIYVWMGCGICTRGMRQRVYSMSNVLVVVRRQAVGVEESSMRCEAIKNRWVSWARVLLIVW
jgi:hypothetical protein